MRILYVGMAHEYGEPSRGFSYEETHFRSSLEGMGHEVVAFDFMERARRDGAERMRSDLVATAAAIQPDLAFFCLFARELDTRTIERVGAEGRCPTVNWFADDHWRFEGFSRHLAPAFTLPITTDPEAVPKYRAIGCSGVLLSQWACNRYAYRKVTDTLEHDVTFVGQPHGTRRDALDRIAAAGVPMTCWGHGWSNGRLDHDAMVRVFSSSRININLAESCEPSEMLGEDAEALVGQPAGNSRPLQIKGRNFEVPGCGGFLLTRRVPHLDRYFALGREVAVYDDEAELPEQILHWLEHEDERAAIARAGHERVLAEHTYDHRFAEVFGALGLS